jgi:large subunit ribosomal protein L34
MKIKLRNSSKKRIRTCGFRKRMKTRSGRKVINARRKVGRHALAVAKFKK